MAATAGTKELSKPLAGGLFVLCWLIAIALWIVTASLPNLIGKDFYIDLGIVFACVGFVAPFVPTTRLFGRILLIALVGVIFFGLGSLFDITVLIYTLRMLLPFLALLAPVWKLSGSLRVFS